MTSRSDVKGYITERTRGRRDWPSERYLAARFASRLAAQLDQLRQSQELTYEALAMRAGTSKAQVIRLLSGTYEGMTTKSMSKLASALRCEIDVSVRPVTRGSPGVRAFTEPGRAYRTGRVATAPAKSTGSR